MSDEDNKLTNAETDEVFQLTRKVLKILDGYDMNMVHAVLASIFGTIAMARGADDSILMLDSIKEAVQGGHYHNTGGVN
jgi:hypothetical protein